MAQAAPHALVAQAIAADFIDNRSEEPAERDFADPTDTIFEEKQRALVFP